MRLSEFQIQLQEQLNGVPEKDLDNIIGEFDKGDGQETSDSEPWGNPGEHTGSEKKSQADLLIEIAAGSNAEFFHTPIQDSFI